MTSTALICAISANEETPFFPRSLYAVARAAAFWQAANYREAYGLFACSGILFNHESPLRSKRFVTQKVVRAARRIAGGSGERLRLGKLDVQRDWGWAHEYVDAMWSMRQHGDSMDFVIATGETRTLKDFVAEAFAAVSLDWRNHAETHPNLMRPTDIPISHADPSLALTQLGWQAQTRMADVVRRMVEVVAFV